MRLRTTRRSFLRTLVGIVLIATSVSFLQGCEKEDAPDPTTSSTPSTGTQTADPSTVTVWITDTGTKYHAAGCSYLNSSARSVTKQWALNNGYTPDSSGRCTPP